MTEAIKILSFVGIPSILLGLYGAIYNKVKKESVKNHALAKGVQALLRDRIIQNYNHYIELEYCPIYAKENTTNMYNEYHNLGGNGTVTKLYQEIMNLPTERKV